MRPWGQRSHGSNFSRNDTESGTPASVLLGQQLVERAIAWLLKKGIPIAVAVHQHNVEGRIPGMGLS
jgi:hypothetical protein